MFQIAIKPENLTRTFYEKVTPNSFSAAISLNAGINHLNFWLLVSIISSCSGKTSKPCEGSVLNYFTRTMTIPSKKEENNFLAKYLWNWSFKEFFHQMTIAANQFDSHDKALDDMLLKRSLEWPIFDIMKTTTKIQWKLKELQIMDQMQL